LDVEPFGKLRAGSGELIYFMRATSCINSLLFSFILNQLKNMKFSIQTIVLLLVSLNTIGCATKENKKEVEKEKVGNEIAQTPNIILMVGDGMGISQISTAFYFGESTPNFEQFSEIGLMKTSSTSHTITDSAAGATAFATGERTYNRAIGVSKDTVAVPTILEQLKEENYQTGLISLTSITHATPASFYAHVKDRDMHEEIAEQMTKGKVDFFAGGGLDFFTKRKDGKNLYQEMQQNGFQMDSVNLISFNADKKNGYLLAADAFPSKTQGREGFLQEATKLSLDYFDAKKQPFFLMVEGSFIDWGGHAKDADMMVQEVLDFDKTLGIVLNYIKENPNTLLVVTADHETGGASVGKYYDVGANGKKVENPEKVAVSFNTDQHTGQLIPVFAKGIGAENFQGIYQNNEIYHKMFQAINKKK